MGAGERLGCHVHGLATVVEGFIAPGLEQGFQHVVHPRAPFGKGFVGNIFKGKVVRVLPGMQAAFVDIGLERAGFIHAADIAPLDEEGMEDRQREVADIRLLVREGQTLVVQVFLVD